jgi:hypothetical protein
VTVAHTRERHTPDADAELNSPRFLHRDYFLKSQATQFISRRIATLFSIRKVNGKKIGGRHAHVAGLRLFLDDAPPALTLGPDECQRRDTATRDSEKQKKIRRDTMTTGSTPGRALGACILLAAFAVQAGDGVSGPEAATPAMQVHIDKRTGQKTPPDDSRGEAAQQTLQAKTAAAPAARSAPSPDLDRIARNVGVPVDSQAPRRSADGSMSARVGLRNMKFLVIKVGEDGTKSVTHETVESVSAPATATDTGEK